MNIDFRVSDTFFVRARSLFTLFTLIVTLTHSAFMQNKALQLS